MTFHQPEPRYSLLPTLSKTGPSLFKIDGNLEVLGEWIEKYGFRNTNHCPLQHYRVQADDAEYWNSYQSPGSIISIWYKKPHWFVTVVYTHSGSETRSQHHSPDPMDLLQLLEVGRGGVDE